MLIVGGIAVELVLILAIVYTPAGQYLFGTAAIPLDVWLFVLPFAAAMMLIEEARKFVARLIRQSTDGQARHGLATGAGHA